MSEFKIKGLAILGSTGSIGSSTLDVVRLNPGRFKVVSLAAGNNIEALKRQVEEFKPRCVSVAAKDAAEQVRGFVPANVEVLSGTDGAVKAATYDGVTMAVSAITGAAGLAPTIAAVRAGIDVALANKESLVMAGPIVMKEAARTGSRILPVDSEHSAVFQSLVGHRREDLKRVILTASGGPFLNKPIDELSTVTPSEALKHPKWVMGRKVTIDSATLMNKGLEVIEAAFLFDMTFDKISVVIHPQSIVHSMVEYNDGSVISQLSTPDMKGPIGYALSYPDRIDSGCKPLSFTGLTLEFSEPDARRFPCLSLAYDAIRAGGTAPAVLNAADEVAVEEFLKGAIPFTGIYEVVSAVTQSHSVTKIETIEDVLRADAWARGAAVDMIKKLSEKRA